MWMYFPHILTWSDDFVAEYKYVLTQNYFDSSFFAPSESLH